MKKNPLYIVLLIVLLTANAFSVRQKIPKVLEESGLEAELARNGPRKARVRARILSHESRSDREYLYCRILCRSKNYSCITAI